MENRYIVNNINIQEIEQAAMTLADAFRHDPLMQWIFLDEDNYDKTSIPIFKTWVKYSVLYGKAYKTPHFEAIGLRKKPGDTKSSIWRMFRSGMLKTPSFLEKEAFRRLLILDDLSTQERLKNMNKNLYWYCWLLGTKPAYQSKGFGSAIMNHTFNIAIKDNLPCYLETASLSSKEVHLSKGYKILSEFQLPGSEVKITSMLKKSC